MKAIEKKFQMTSDAFSVSPVSKKGNNHNSQRGVTEYGHK